MRAIALAAAFLLLAAQEAPKPPDDSPMVKAAKAAGGKRKPTGKVITNADVKKSTGKLVPVPPAKETKPAPAVDTVGPLAKQDEQHRLLAAAAKRVDDAEKKAAELEAELRRIEQAYYAESDLSLRDTEWVSRFEQTKRQLDLARKELADARDALEKCCQ